MELPSEGYLLRIIIGEADRYEHKHLYEWIVLKAREQGLAGATVVRGMMGYGANSYIKTSSILCLSEDLPVIIEIVDIKEKLECFLDLIDPVIREGVVTLEKMQVRIYRHNQSKKHVN
jgi:PII-like signaling protein